MLTEDKVLQIDPSIFRAYDIRGIVGDALTEQSVYAIGKALGSMAIEQNEKRMVVGRDGRLSGPLLSEALFSGITSTGCDVINIGVVPTPLLYYATFVLDSSSGVMLTGSHNPAEYNGLKMILGRKNLAEEEIQKIKHYIEKENYQYGEGKLSNLDMIDRYMLHVERDTKLNRPLKIVIDCGNGVASNVAPELYRKLGCEVIGLYCDIDGSFPNHHPDPSQLENMQDLIESVKSNGADLGLAFDGDGDRLGVVTNKGEVIWPDRQLMLFAKSVLQKRPNAKIIYDVKCTSHLDKVINDLGGEPLMWKTGHSFIKTKLQETQAALAGEMSGHIFFKEGWYGFDDAIFAGAKLLEIVANETRHISCIFSEFPDSINTPELKVFTTDAEKFELMNKIIKQADFKDAKRVTIDGLRVNFKDGWGLVRPSNTTPCLVLRFEADSKDALARIQKQFKDLLLSIKNDLVLPF